MTRRLAVLVFVAIALVALPAAAQAATWERVADPAPGGTLEYGDPFLAADLAVAGGTPYLAATQPDGSLGVWRPTASGTSWQQVGGSLSEGPVGSVAIAVAGSTVWVAWTEGGELHVARLVGGSFQEVAGAARPVDRDGVDIVIYNGRPYVAYNEGTSGSSRLAVLRLNRAGTAFEQVSKGLPTGEALPTLAVSRGRLYVSDGLRILRLNSGGRVWQKVATSQTTIQDMADVNGTLYVVGAGAPVQRLNSKKRLVPVGEAPFGGTTEVAGHAGIPYVAGSDEPAPGAIGPVQVAAFSGGTWQPRPSPSADGEGGQPLELVSADDGSLWMLWWSSATGSVFPPQTLHVARYTG